MIQIVSFTFQRPRDFHATTEADLGLKNGSTLFERIWLV